jgi:hypothetical protein
MPDFSWANVPKREKCTKWPKIYQMSKSIPNVQNIPNVQKHAKWSKNIPNGLKTYQHYSFKDPPNSAQIENFCYAGNPARQVCNGFDPKKDSIKDVYFWLKGCVASP